MKIRLGLFDSGLGGLTVLKRVIERHGNQEYVYLGDLARVPYGDKSSSEIRKIAREIVDWLNEQELDVVLIACNTTNSLALDIVRKFSKSPVFGLIEPASAMLLKEKIGVLATSSTVASKAYTSQILAFNPNAFVLEQACPAFVPMIETGQINTNEMRQIAKEYIQPLIYAGVEEIILGCSHYPLLLPLLKELLPVNIRLIDPALGIARELDSFLGPRKSSFEHESPLSNTRFCVTADKGGFATRAMYWLNKYPEVELVSLRSKACVF